MYSNDKDELYAQLRNAVIEMEEDLAGELAGHILECKFSAKEAIIQALIPAMEHVSELYAKEKYFIPELLSCADAMYEAMHQFEKVIEVESVGYDVTIIIGTVFGDTHDIGKNIVSLFLKCAGFRVIDVGRDVLPEQFVTVAKENEAQIIAISTIMTTTMDNIGDVIMELKKQNLRDRVKVIVGGKPISPRFAREIGADGYSTNASEAIKLVKRLMCIPINN